MDRNFSTGIVQTSPRNVGVALYIKIQYKLCKIFLQTYQEFLYHLKEIFQNIPSKFVDALDPL